MPLLVEDQIGCLVWSPLAGGYLSGKFSPGGDAAAEGRRKDFDFPPLDKDKADRLVGAMQPIAKAHGTSVARVALAYVLSKPWVCSMIIGARTAAQLADNLEAGKLKLDAAQIAKLDELSALAPEYPGWMLERQGQQRMPQQN